MKKNYFSTLFAALMLFVAMPAKAEVSSVSDFFGKYKFTANVEVTEAGKALDVTFPEECEVIIAKCSDDIYDGQFQGFPGATGVQKINGINTEKNELKITNPNHGFPWGNLCMSDGNGMNPYGPDSMYNDIRYAYNPETKAITMPDFTLVSMSSDYKVATVMVKFTNATLTLVEAETIEVADLSGEWHFTATPGGFNTMENSTLPTEWDMTLTATNENNSTYDISLTLGDFAPLALTATFDGVQLVIPFNETYFDEENKIGIVNMYGEARPGEITFNLGNNENVLSITSGMTIAQDSISEEVKGGYLQWYMAGNAKRETVEETVPFTWDGTYTVKANNVQIYNQDYNFPAEFEVEIEYNEGWGMFLVTKIFGMDVVALNQGGILVTPSEDNPNMAEIEVGTMLQSVVPGESYLYLMDMNATNEWAIQLTRNEDGTLTMENFCITYYKSGDERHSTVAYYTGVTAEKKEIADGIENIAVENKVVEGIFDMMGRKLDAITAPGLYIVNGNKVLVK